MVVHRILDIRKLTQGLARGFTTSDEPIKDIICAYDKTNFCSPECSACFIDESKEKIVVECQRGKFVIGNLDISRRPKKKQVDYK